jgi:hypothetical protein
MKRILASIIALGALLLAATLLVAATDISKPWIGSSVETWQIGNQNLKLRIDRRSEICPFMCGTYYVYQYAPSGSDNWREIFTVFQDDPHPLRRDQIGVLTDQIGYVFHSSKYAVTLDNGLSWSVWEVNGNLPFERYKVYPYIEELNIQANGDGTMRLNYISNERVSLPTLFTEDYGRSWFIK